MGVEFAVIGGVAVSHRAIERTTKDLDLSVAVADDEEAESIVRSLSGSGYRIETVIESEVEGRLATVRLISEGEREIFIDLLFASSGIEPEVVKTAEPIEVFHDITIKVASRAALIALKTLSANIKRRPQDVIDLGHLLVEASGDEIAAAYELVDLITIRGYNRGKDLRADLNQYVMNAFGTES